MLGWGDWGTLMVLWTGRGVVCPSSTLLSGRGIHVGVAVVRGRFGVVLVAKTLAFS